MRTNKIISASLFIGILLTISSAIIAQDFVKVAAQGTTKVLLENDQVRVIQIETAPGEVTPWHSHPNYLLYALTDGKLETTCKVGSDRIETNSKKITDCMIKLLKKQSQ